MDLLKVGLQAGIAIEELVEGGGGVERGEWAFGTSCGAGSSAGIGFGGRGGYGRRGCHGGRFVCWMGCFVGCGTGEGTAFCVSVLACGLVLYDMKPNWIGGDWTYYGR